VKDSLKKMALIVLGSASTQIIAGDYNYKPGMWETTTKMEIKGAPPEMAAMMNIPDQTTRGCVKENDNQFEKDKDCKYENKRISAKKMHFNITCNKQGKVTKGKGEVNYSGKTTSGWFEIEVPGPSGPMTMKSTFTSKYIGACK